MKIHHEIQRKYVKIVIILRRPHTKNSSCVKGLCHFWATIILTTFNTINEFFGTIK